MATVSKGQIEAISSRIGKNNRPVQDLHDRVVKMDDLTVDAK
jgi:carbonic anhydrase